MTLFWPILDPPPPVVTWQIGNFPSQKTALITLKNLEKMSRDTFTTPFLPLVIFGDNFPYPPPEGVTYYLNDPSFSVSVCCRNIKYYCTLWMVWLHNSNVRKPCSKAWAVWIMVSEKLWFEWSWKVNNLSDSQIIFKPLMVVVEVVVWQCDIE